VTTKLAAAARPNEGMCTRVTVDRTAHTEFLRDTRQESRKSLSDLVTRVIARKITTTSKSAGDSPHHAHVIFAR